MPPMSRTACKVDAEKIPKGEKARHGSGTPLQTQPSVGRGRWIFGLGASQGYVVRPYIKKQNTIPKRVLATSTCLCQKFPHHTVCLLYTMHEFQCILECEMLITINLKNSVIHKASFLLALVTTPSSCNAQAEVIMNPLFVFASCVSGFFLLACCFLI